MKRARSLLFAGLVGFCSPSCGSQEETPMPLFELRKHSPLSFSNPADCAECHQQHVDEWKISNHAYAQKDPVYLAMVRMGQRQTEGKLGQFCVQCHSPVGMVMEQTPVTMGPEGYFVQSFDALDDVAKQGVSCDVCHSISDVVEPVNARTVMTPNGKRLGTIKDPVPTPSHQSAFSELHTQSRLCGACHAVTNARGALIEETFPEWEASSAAAEGKTCQTCHMPEYSGRAAKDGPMRTVHRHTFVGVDVSLLPPEEFPGYHVMRELTTQLLRESAYVTHSFDANARRLSIAIENRAGHSLPSGATAERQMWIEFVVTDSTGSVVFETGTLDARGDLRDGLATHTLLPGTDPQLIYFGQQMIGDPGLPGLVGTAREARLKQLEAECLPIALGALAATSTAHPVAMPWSADWQCNYLIPPDETALRSLDLSALESGTYNATLKLRFRTFPMYFLRLLEEEASLDPLVKTRVPIVDMNTEEFVLRVP